MARVKWTAPELRLHLSPVGKPLGRKAKRISVFKAYGDPQQRLVQALVGAMGSEVTYLELTCRDVGGSAASVTHTVPIPACRDSSISAAVGLAVSDLVDGALDAGVDVLCYGSSRERWRVGIDWSGDDGRDVTDNLTDKCTDYDIPACDIEPNGIRAKF